MGSPYYRYRRSLDPFAYIYDNDDYDEEASQGEGRDSDESRSEISMDGWSYGVRTDDEEHDIVGSQSETSTADDDEILSAPNSPPKPPPYGYPDNTDGNVPRPDFVLIEPHAYFADRTNATTAYCETSGLGARGTIKLTFCAARPPLVSYFCVHATAFGYTEFAVKPHIIAAESDGGLVLLRLAIDKIGAAIDRFGFARDERGFPVDKLHYLVYDAGGPSLRHIPQPGEYPVFSPVFNDHSFAIVRTCGSRCGQEEHDSGDYVIAAQVRGADLGLVGTSLLCLYHSGTNTWSKQPVLAKKKESHCHFTDKTITPRRCGGISQSHATSKTITIGGDRGTVAWVDLCNILLCNVLDDCPKLRVVPLPPQSRHGNPRSVRDIAFVDGFIKYLEMESHVVPGSSRTLNRWKASIWSIKTSRKSRWHKDYELESSDISEPLQMLWLDAGTPQPTLSTLRISLASLSLQDDGLFYFLAKNRCGDDNNNTTWIIALDMSNKTVQSIDEFNPSGTVKLAKSYDASRISKYLKAAPV
jgi:hypothetical protein